MADDSARVPAAVHAVVGLCAVCSVVWVAATFLDPRHAALALQLPWLCPDCYRPLQMGNTPRPLPEGLPC